MSLDGTRQAGRGAFRGVASQTTASCKNRPVGVEMKSAVVVESPFVFRGKPASCASTTISELSVGGPPALTRFAWTRRLTELLGGEEGDGGAQSKLRGVIVSLLSRSCTRRGGSVVGDGDGNRMTFGETADGSLGDAPLRMSVPGDDGKRLVIDPNVLVSLGELSDSSEGPPVFSSSPLSSGYGRCLSSVLTFKFLVFFPALSATSSFSSHSASVRLRFKGHLTPAGLGFPQSLLHQSSTSLCEDS